MRCLREGKKDGLPRSRLDKNPGRPPARPAFSAGRMPRGSCRRCPCEGTAPRPRTAAPVWSMSRWGKGSSLSSSISAPPCIIARAVISVPWFNRAGGSGAANRPGGGGLPLCLSACLPATNAEGIPGPEIYLLSMRVACLSSSPHRGLDSEGEAARLAQVLTRWDRPGEPGSPWQYCVPPPIERLLRVFLPKQGPGRKTLPQFGLERSSREGHPSSDPRPTARFVNNPADQATEPGRKFMYVLCAGGRLAGSIFYLLCTPYSRTLPPSGQVLHPRGPSARVRMLSLGRLTMPSRLHVGHCRRPSPRIDRLQGDTAVPGSDPDPPLPQRICRLATR